MEYGKLTFNPEKVMYTESLTLHLVGHEYDARDDIGDDVDMFNQAMEVERRLAARPEFVAWFDGDLVNVKYASGYKRITDSCIDVVMDNGDELRLFDEDVAPFIEAFNNA